MNIESNLKPRAYTEKEVQRVVNPKQARLYIKARKFPIDMYPSVNSNGDDIVVYVFLREDVTNEYKSWCNHTLI